MNSNWFHWFFNKESTTVDNNIAIEKPHYVFIHGANQSRVCWNYIVKELHLKEKDYTCIEYSSIDSFFDNLETMHQDVAKIPDPSCLIGHSLGGIYAVHLYGLFPKKFTQGISISTPYGGSSAAEYLKYISPSTRLFKDIGTKSLPITQAFEIKIQIPWIQLVTVRGNSPWLKSRNDGIVTERSMTVRNDIDYIEVAANHYEVLVYDQTVEIIKEKTFKSLDTTS